LANFDSKIRPALKREHGDMSEEEMEVFKRKWEVRADIDDSSKITYSANARAVLLHILRGRFLDEDIGGCHHHGREGRRSGVDGGNSHLMPDLVPLTLAASWA